MDDNYTRRAKVVHVADADTIDLLVDLGYEEYSKRRIRLKDVDAYELHTPKGDEAKVWAENLLMGKDVRVQSFLDKAQEFDKDRGRRYIGLIYLADESGAYTINFNELIVANGYGVVKHY